MNGLEDAGPAGSGAVQDTRPAESRRRFQSGSLLLRIDAAAEARFPGPE